jgi:aminoglycoside phosphotransferase (APT) family kinase protein
LGQPGLITAFVPGATAPSDVAARAVTGVGIRFEHWIPLLAPQFVDHLARIHAFDWHAAELGYFEAPAAGTTQAALRQVNWWARVWADDRIEPDPLVTFVLRWLREHAPVCRDPVVVHGDYRIGNFMFVQPSGTWSAVLDWELAHLGDLHQDLAWCVQRLFSTPGADGERLICGLMPRETFFARYAAAAGRDIDREVIRYYEILNAWRCIIINNATACRAAREWARYGICVNSVCFGAVETPMTEVIRGPKFIERTLAQIPLGRIAQPAEVATPCCFLLSDAASYITGQHLSIDGGAHIGF